MRDQSTPVGIWIKRDLVTRYATVLREDVPQDMLSLLDTRGAQN